MNSTISENRDSGIASIFGTLRMRFVTISGNLDRGLVAFDGGSGVALLNNVLIANNLVEDCEISSRVGVAPIPTTGTNLDSDGTCLFGGTIPSDIGLDALADNGGPTQTNALREGSPAIDAGDPPVRQAVPHGLAGRTGNRL